MMILPIHKTLATLRKPLSDLNFKCIPFTALFVCPSPGEGWSITSSFQPQGPEAREPPAGREKQHQNSGLRHGVAPTRRLDAGDQLRFTPLRLSGSDKGEWFLTGPPVRPAEISNTNTLHVLFLLGALHFEGWTPGRVAVFGGWRHVALVWVWC